ncbi:MAG: hypothetical protein QW724_02175 [Nitrososphaerota archaeon]
MVSLRLGLDYEYQKLGMRNRVERFFRCLKERIAVFYNKLSTRDPIQRITNLNIFLNLIHTILPNHGLGCG